MTLGHYIDSVIIFSLWRQIKLHLTKLQVNIKQTTAFSIRKISNAFQNLQMQYWIMPQVHNSYSIETLKRRQSLLDYASLVWASNLTEIYNNTLQTIQNKAFDPVEENTWTKGHGATEDNTKLQWDKADSSWKTGLAISVSTAVDTISLPLLGLFKYQKYGDSVKNPMNGKKELLHATVHATIGSAEKDPEDNYRIKHIPRVSEGLLWEVWREISYVKQK